MAKTPEKTANLSLNQSLTPVRFTNSPRLKSPAHDSNYAVCKSRLDQVITQVRDNYAKWQLAQKRGLALCTAIEAVKSRSLEPSKEGNADKDSLYPKELQGYCDKLAIISSIFEDITKNTRELLKQLRALSKLPGSNTEIFFRSWNLSHFVDFLDVLLKRYEQETLVKLCIMRELPHCMSRKALVAYTTSWEYPQNVDAYVALQFLILSAEIRTC